jgi:hypothetical protein
MELEFYILLIMRLHDVPKSFPCILKNCSAQYITLCNASLSTSPVVAVLPESSKLVSVN